MSSSGPPAEEALQKPPAQGTIVKPPPKAPWLANCDAFKNPPPSYQKIHNNCITPLYMLGWTCSREEFYANVSDNRWQANSSIHRGIVWNRLRAGCGDKTKILGSPLQIEVMSGFDGEVYLGAMFNYGLEKHYEKLKDMWMEDEFLYLREAFGIPKNTALDETLAWYRFPPHLKKKDFKALRWQVT